MKPKKLYSEQLELIRHRFALAQRNLELECAQNQVKYAIEHQEELDTQLTRALDKLNRYWELILKLNEPETLPNHKFQVFSEEVVDEIKQLSEYVYRDINGELKPLLTSTEISQLMLPIGNLTTLERLKIEAHVTHTYEFLKRIPWTNQLKNVPIIASGHHERLDGSGYPQGLKQQDIPIQTQILTIADIYDALTPSDRPYKRRLDLETSLTILKEQAMKNKINSDLVELFEQRQVFSVLGHT